ncbi:helix-turn-helix domain-containing protein [Pantoea vagans]|uniref:helix-turn-helix domain-containing protein n=1 Tax=Pantoea vagans TaxID=470934 RepID=UPI003FA37E5A
MISVPFPVITLLALILLLPTIYAGNQRHNGALRFLLACIVLISINTFRWQYESDFCKGLQSVLAMFLPAIAWHSFTPGNEEKWQRDVVVLLLPATLSLLVRLVWAPATDFILSLLYFIYGFGLLKNALSGHPSITLKRPGKISQHIILTFFAGSFLCLSGLTDLLIAFDFNISDGKHAASIIVVTQFALLPIVGTIIYHFLNSPQRSEPVTRQETMTIDDKSPAEDMTALYMTLEKQVYETEMYLNPDLTLALLARKTGIPARQFSAAVNSVKKCNVSQWINGFRIERAKKLLLNTSLPVTHIMMESGFQTKSNFNREFQRLSGLSPGLFRQQARDNSGFCSEKV